MYPHTLLVLTLSLLGILPNAYAGEITDKCSEFFDGQQYDKALISCTQAAQQGDTKALFNLGIMYDYAQGVPQDFEHAVDLYTKAAEQGHSNAQSHLGFMYDNGQGVTQDYKQAAFWYTKAAQKGVVQAQFYLGFMYLSGNGVIKDNAQAYAWLDMAAASGHEGATRSRGIVERQATPEQIEQGQKLSSAYFKKYAK